MASIRERFPRRFILGLCTITTLATAVMGQVPQGDVIVESESRYKERTRSSLLTPPGQSRSSAPIDWRQIPPWQQSSFCGIRARGTFFVFVVDCSGSMGEAERWLRVRHELRHTLSALQFPQRYLVIFYNDRPLVMPGGVPLSATRTNISRTLAWVGRTLPDGPTDPRESMMLALGLRPDAIFLVSDGEYPEGVPAVIEQSNTARTPIHCIDLSGGAGGTDLQRIAATSGGSYAALGAP